MERASSSLATKELAVIPLDFDSEVAMSGILRVLVGGLDNAGKSTFACSLYQALQQEGFPASLYELDRWSDTHDCILERKDWSKRNKNFSVQEQDYAHYIDLFTQDNSPIVIGDLEGRYQNDWISKLEGLANYGVLVTREPRKQDYSSDFPQTEEGWIDLFNKIKVPIKLKVHSRLPGQDVRFDRVNITGLERSAIPNHPGIQKIARNLIDLCKYGIGECAA